MEQFNVDEITFIQPTASEILAEKRCLRNVIILYVRFERTDHNHYTFIGRRVCYYPRTCEGVRLPGTGQFHTYMSG